MKTMLNRIIAQKHREIEAAKSRLPISEIEQQACNVPAPKGFKAALKKKVDSGQFALIAEIKKASPSKGLIRDDFDPAELAQAYEIGGATCLSVLTDVPFFQGHPVYLKEVSTISTLPLLRKDFFVDPYQVIEARAWGADCILIIMAAVNDETALILLETAYKWGMDALVEVHNQVELSRALKLNTQLIGINNRNLDNFETSLQTTERLAPFISDRIVISESGISQHEDLLRLQKVGVKTFLVGECLMRQDNVEAATKSLLGLDGNTQFQETSKSDDDQTSDYFTNVNEIESMIETETKGAFEAISSSSSTEENYLETIPEQNPLFMETPFDPISEILDPEKSLSETHTCQQTELSHINQKGEANMVDISDKSVTQRTAIAEGFVSMTAETLNIVQNSMAKKGDVLATARIAGIMAAKRTSDLIPLCHPLSLSTVEIDFKQKASPSGIHITAKVKVDGKTGVEMEALSAVTVTCLTIYDMLKAVDKSMCFSDIRLVQKEGGRSGLYRAENAAE